jgi:hypothetical protein
MEHCVFFYRLSSLQSPNDINRRAAKHVDQNSKPTDIYDMHAVTNIANINKYYVREVRALRRN